MTNSFTGFHQNDFDVFAIEGLDNRMEGIKELIRPKLETLGQHFAPSLSLATGEEMFYHVAKHARRTVNPPKDTWVAWAGDKRGYKKHPHFQVGLWGTHLFVWYAVIYESPFKEEISRSMKEHLEEILEMVPDDFRWSPDHMQPGSTPQAVLGREGVLQLIDRLQQVKKAEILCGINIDRHDPVLADGDKLLSKLDATFAVLAKLYNLSKLRTTGLA
ncbi:YktB family protein [Brevibacillus borstelensis]|uniref:YktB family protein n=1 Tax=Brevibacillus borstelensis TaxID=45462 RepID=UPI003D193C76